ncbi:response regulator [Lapidilactobacillus achengensis]|uniref:Response regulator n=1 Tax=Lapidilactobacillus achengensis TaxID=2486000 RepID=A0ABW1UQW9_9LACO|nr:response regulator [Lapidilactobacillus achengensis]
MYRVMLVDDEVMILKGLRRIIDWSAAGFEIVKVASSGQEALDFLAQQAVDLVITDVTMPKMNGLTLVSQAFAQGHHFLFVILSGYDEFDYARKSLQLGALNYLMKPIDTQELSNTLLEAKERLDASQKPQYPQQRLLDHAIHGQATDAELVQLGQESGFADVDPNSFYLLAFVGLGGAQEFINYLLKVNREWFMNADGALYLLFVGSRWQVDQFLLSLPREYGAQTQLIVMSASSSDFSALVPRFNSVQRRISTAKFYDQRRGLLRIDELNRDQEQHFPELDIARIDQLINAGNREELQDLIQVTFMAMSQAQADADYVRQVSFWFLATLNRRLHFNETFYNNQLELINQLHDFKKILDLNLSWVAQLENSAIQDYSPNVAAAIQYIYLNYHQDINLGLAADQLHLSSMYLGQLFKQETGQTFSRFLNHYRIEQSKYLLRNTSESVSEIGMAVGYSTPNYFFRMFKQETDQSPKEYRHG